MEDVLNRTLVNTWIKTGDRESFTMSRRLIRTEGLLCGGSSGAAVAGALRAIKQLNIGQGKTVVVILPDSLRNYITKVPILDWLLSFIANHSSWMTRGCKSITSSPLIQWTLPPPPAKQKPGKKPQSAT